MQTENPQAPITADDYIDTFLVSNDTVGMQRVEIKRMLHEYGITVGNRVKQKCADKASAYIEEDGGWEPSAAIDRDSILDVNFDEFIK